MHPGNPAVAAALRRWLSATAARDPDLLDTASLAWIWPALRACAVKHPGGLMADLAGRLGAEPGRARDGGALSALFYAACSLSDDIQDGDAARYMPGPLAWHVNAQGHLLALVGVRAAELGLDAAEPYRVLARMITGQRAELARDGWGGAAYRRVARLSAGAQMGLYAAWAATIAGAAVAPWRAWGQAVGALAQVAWDVAERDPRFLDLGQGEVREIAVEVVDAVEDVIRLLPAAHRAWARATTEGMRRHAGTAASVVAGLGEL